MEGKEQVIDNKFSRFFHTLNFLSMSFFSRILLIQNCPEKFHPPQSPQSHHVGRMLRNNSSTMGVGGVGVVSGFSNNSSCAQTLSSRQHTIDLADATMISENIGELDPDQSSSSVLTYQHPLSAANHRHYQHHLGQIVANIENSSINYDRDWTLDDISQASLFKPTGSQADSLTPLPYHEQLTDSQSNIYNNTTAMHSGSSNHHHSSNIYNNPNINLQNCSVSTSSYEKIKSSSSQKMPNLGNDLNVFKVKSKHPNSAVFVENRDILNDAAAINSNYNPKIYHRHSTAVDYFPMATTPLSSSIDFYENLDERIGELNVNF
jgi:E3 ubiquitin-protein ligase MARCH1/8